jgi:predicted DNA-binding WGR domain protein/Arc/MetJ family transcription regulator
MSTTVTAQELHYVDPKANSLKFYRVFTLGGTVAVQYGRLGTFGTFKRTVFDDLAAATAAAVKQVEAKFKKGYEPVKATTLVFDVDPTDTDLDTAMAAVAEGTVAVGVAVSQAEAHQAARACLNNTPIDIDAEVLPRVRAALDTAMTTVDPDAVDGVVRPMLAESIPAGRLEQPSRNSTANASSSTSPTARSRSTTAQANPRPRTSPKDSLARSGISPKADGCSTAKSSAASCGCSTSPPPKGSSQPRRRSPTATTLYGSSSTP